MARSCSYCHCRSLDGTASVYWAYYPGPDNRLSYVTKLCADCTEETVIPLMAMAPMDRELASDANCILCGIGTEDDPNWLYATVYIPHREAVSVEALLCGACMARATSAIAEGGRRLPDRNSYQSRASRDDSRWSLLSG